MREAFGRRREIALRLRLVAREQVLNDGLERLVRRVSEALDRSPEHGVVLQKILGDARGLLASINGKELSDGTEGSLARILAAESAVRGLVEELRVETTKWMQIETRRPGDMINGHANGHVQHNGSPRVEEREKSLPGVPPPPLLASLPTSSMPISPIPGSPLPMPSTTPTPVLEQSPSTLEPTPPALAQVLVPPTPAVQHDTPSKPELVPPTSLMLEAEGISVPDPESISSIPSAIAREELPLQESQPIASVAAQEILQASVTGSGISVEPIAGDDVIAAPDRELSQAEIVQPIPGSDMPVELPASEEKIQVAISYASLPVEDATSPPGPPVLQVIDICTSHSASAELVLSQKPWLTSMPIQTQDSESSDTAPVPRVIDNTTQNTGWGSWTRMIPSSSRSSSSAPTLPPTFGNVMTTCRLRHASSIQTERIRLRGWS